MSKVESAIQWMENTAKDNAHGYDQRYRWGEKGDYDCSSAVITAWEQTGVPVKTKGATYTGNMYNIFKLLGFREVTSQINLATGAGLIRGDVLLNTKKHTAMYCGNGLEVEASINENGKAIGGKAGDQTGKEFLIRNYRNYPWNHVLRYIEVESNTELSKTPMWVGKCTAQLLAVRKWAGTQYDQLKSYPWLGKGNLVDVCDVVKDAKGADWYYVRIAGSVYGFCSAKYIVKA